MKNLIKFAALSLSFLGLMACQNLDRPELGEFPKDASVPGGPLKFYVAFDGTSEDPLRNAVDSVRAKFPTDNPLKSITGVSGMAIQGEKFKYVKYSSANDFAQTAKSFSVSMWLKRGLSRTEHLFSMPAPGYHWSEASMFLLAEGSANEPILKLFVKDAVGEKWFEWVPWGPSGAVTGLYDGQWHHLVLSYDATTSTMTLYKDGVAGTSVAWANHGNIQLEPSKISALKIGAGPQEFSAQDIQNNADDWLKNSWTGGIDQFRLYAKALTLDEVKTLHAQKK